MSGMNGEHEYFYNNNDELLNDRFDSWSLKINWMKYLCVLYGKTYKVDVWGCIIFHIFLLKLFCGLNGVILGAGLEFFKDRPVFPILAEKVVF